MQQACKPQGRHDHIFSKSGAQPMSQNPILSMTILVRAEKKSNTTFPLFLILLLKRQKSLLQKKKKSKQASIQIHQKLIKRDGVFASPGKRTTTNLFSFSSSLHHEWFDMRA
jgi:hypothetical protein